MFQLAGAGRLSASLLFLFVLPFADAGQVNRTIDDTKGDIVTGAKPTYLPTTGGVWAGADCAKCAVQPNSSLAFDGTWTAATYHATLGMTSIKLPFTGTAIYVYFILPNTVAPGITTQTECNFTLDGQAAGSFFHAPNASFEFIYNALVFSRSNLPNATHTLNISTSGVDHDVFINFDYAIYTVNESPPAASSTSSPSQTSSSSSLANSVNTTILHSTSQISSTTSLTTSSTTSLSTTSSNSSPSQYSSISTTSGANSTSQTASAFSSNGHKGNSNLVGAVVGGSAGAVVVLLLIFFLLCRRRRRNIQNTKLSPTIPVPFNGVPSSSTNRPTSEFFPARIPTTYSSDPGSHDYNHEYLNEITSPLSILARREDGPTTTTYAIPLRPLRHSEASRQLRRHMGMGTIHRPALSDRKQRMQLQEQQQWSSSWDRELDESLPEYSSELSPTIHRYRPSLSFLRTSRI